MSGEFSNRKVPAFTSICSGHGSWSIQASSTHGYLWLVGAFTRGCPSVFSLGNLADEVHCIIIYGTLAIVLLGGLIGRLIGWLASYRWMDASTSRMVMWLRSAFLLAIFLLTISGHGLFKEGMSTTRVLPFSFCISARYLCFRCVAGGAYLFQWARFVLGRTFAVSPRERVADYVAFGLFALIFFLCLLCFRLH